jgi:ribose transport system permease protein
VSDAHVDNVTEGGAAVGGPTPGGTSTSSATSWLRRNVRQVVMVGSFFVMLAIFSSKSSDFVSLNNFQNVLNALPVLGTMAIGVTVVLILGEFDLSVPNVAALTAAVVAIASTQTPVPLLIILALGLLLSSGIGAVNGAAVGYGKAPAFVVTLAVGSMAFGVELLAQSKIDLGQTSIALTNIPELLQMLSVNHIFGLELSFWLLILLAVIVGVGMVYSPWGRHVQAIGGNETAARLAGVPVRRTKLLAFTLTALLAGVAGIMFAARSGYFANALPPYLLPAYAAAFFGAAGVGRRGFSIPATLFGALYLQVLANGLTILNEPQWLTQLVQGIVLFAAVLLARSGTKS